VLLQRTAGPYIGSTADKASSSSPVRFAPKSEQIADIAERWLCAKRRHSHCSKGSYSIVSFFEARLCATPRCVREGVERDFQVTTTVALWWWQPTPCEVYLHGRQHQRRHREVPIPLRPELDEFALVAVLQMQIVPPLGGNGALPRGPPAVWTVVVPRKEACVARQLQNPLNGPPELPSIASREIGARRPRIGHEESIVNESRVPHDVGDRAEGMTG